MEIGAGKFKAHCLQLMDRVRDTHERVCYELVDGDWEEGLL